ncbi:glycosyltransferase family 4 protein [Nonomuraea sp. NPDC050556]|uniref:glycosyltransferase family 4 protein n=1 Tax=Nonomuraea sp. NPDC050556 TaxID=3364369 RepID=UPI0037B99423
MRITYLLLTAYGMGGTVRTVLSQANTMAENGHDVEVVSVCRTRRVPHFQISPKVRVRRLMETSLAEPDVSPVLAEKLIPFLREERDGILVSTRPSIGLLVAEHTTSDVIKVTQEHTPLFSRRDEIQEAIARTYGAFDAIVTLTDEDGAAYARWFDTVTSIPNAVHTTDVPKTDHQSKTIITAGRLVGVKGYPLLLRAFKQVVARHPDWRLRIYGNGWQQERLRRIVVRNHLYNHAYVLPSTTDLDAELARSAIFAMSSRSEGFPMVLLEAINCGLPVASFDCPVGPRAIVTHGHDGLLVAPGDVDALAQALIQLIEDEPLRRRMGANALATAAQYAPEAIHPRWERLFEDLTARRHADPTTRTQEDSSCASH